MTWTTYLGGSNVTGLAEVERTRRLSRPSSGIVNIASEDVSVTEGSTTMRIYNGASLIFKGVVWHVQDDGDENMARSVITAYDPMIYWPKRPVRGSETDPYGAGNFSRVSLFEEKITGPEIMEEAVRQSISYEGTLKTAIGSIETGGADLTGAPSNWPMTLDDLRRLLCSTGKLDVVMTPVEGSDLASMSCYDGGYGGSAGISLGWGTGANNIRKITRTVDMDTVANKLYYYLGQKLDDQHFMGNITGTAPHVGGTWPAEIVSLFQQSRSDYGVLMDIKIHDSFASEAVPGVRYLYERLWQNETLIRSRPRTLVKWWPVRGVQADGNFDIGDLISVSAGSRLRGGFSGTQRIYDFTEKCNREGIVEVTNVTTSPDSEL